MGLFRHPAGRRLTVIQRQNLKIMIIAGDQSNQQLADRFNCNVRTIQRYRKEIEATGGLLDPKQSDSRYNALRLLPWALEVCLYTVFICYVLTAWLTRYLIEID